MKPYRLPFLFLGFAIFCAFTISPKITELQEQTLFDYLSNQEEEILTITIATNLQLLDDHRMEQVYQETKFSIDGVMESTIKIRTRGRYRLLNCDNPPLKLNFSKTDLKEKRLDPEFDKLKLVLPCDDSADAEKWVAKEMAVYELYQLVSPYAFRVIPVKVAMVDTANKIKTKTFSGFLIEHQNEVAHHHQTTTSKKSVVNPSLLEANSSSDLAIFQYLIGNEDWSTQPVKNIKLIKDQVPNAFIPLPYDFDFAGIVDADYAIPSIDWGHTDVTQRHIFKNYLTAENSINLLSDMEELSEKMEKSIHENVHLSNSSKRQMIRYLHRSFSLAKKWELEEFHFMEKEKISCN